MEAVLAELDSEVRLEQAQVDFYRENGFLVVRGLLSPPLLRHYGGVITQKVLELNNQHKPMHERTTYEKAFLQVTNIFRESEEVAHFVMGKRLASVAAQLMGKAGVRLYHDQALYKEPSGGKTPWHVDQYYWPLASEKSVTAWVPLQETPVCMGPLAFAAKSHLSEVGSSRTLQISDESEATIQGLIADHGFAHVEEAFSLGDVSFHSGWTLHHAGPNAGSEARRVMTVIYMDEEMRLATPLHADQERDREAFCSGIAVGDVIASPLNPVIYSAKSTS